MIGIINYTTNNINCFIKIIKRLKKEYKIINNYNDYNNNIEKLIIPGIGSYNSCMNYIKEKKIDHIIFEHLNKNKKIMCICLGMHILSSIGTEGGAIKGLDIFKNTSTIKLETDKILPHIGWNKLNLVDKNNKIFNNININADFYFVHSYHFVSNNDKIILATSRYGSTEFISCLLSDNIFAVQFHPEKSGSNGVKLISNFINDM